MGFLVGKKFASVEDIPLEYFSEHKAIFAVVEEVVEADILLVQHIPGGGLGGGTRRNSKNNNKVEGPQPQEEGVEQKSDVESKDECIKVNIYGVQPPTAATYNEMARNFTRELILDKMVKITLLRKEEDHVIGVVETVVRQSMNFPERKAQDVSIELAREGLGVVHKGSDFNHHRGSIDHAIDFAKHEKQGVWSMPKEVVVPPPGNGVRATT